MIKHGLFGCEEEWWEWRFYAELNYYTKICTISQTVLNALYSY